MLLKFQERAYLVLLTLLPGFAYLLVGSSTHGRPVASLAELGWQWVVAIAVWLLLALILLRSHQRAVAELRGLLRQDRAQRDQNSPLLVRKDELGCLAREIGGLVDAVHLRQERLHQQQKIDPVTGLPNRVVVNDRIEMATARATRGHRSFALLLVDVLKLSDINSRYGHQVGDMALKILARRMRGMLRASDTICRFGSDQFVLVIEDGQQDQLQVVVDKVVASVNCYITAQGENLRVRAACGLVFYGAHGTGAEELLRRAEIAMNTAKERGLTVVGYTDGQDESHLRSIMLQDDFYAGVRGNEFCVLYQPKMTLSRRDVGQVEALVRWNHPHLGLLRPDEFVPLAERTGQIKLLTHWVLEQAMRQQLSWQRAGRAIVISVNLSPLDLADDQILAVLERLSCSFNIDPDFLVLEVTESAILEDISTAVEVINALKDRGYQISIDDFGTGYSSLAQIRRLPVRELKIDKSFVMRMRENPEDAVIVRSTIEMAHSLGLQVVAEGVESEEALALLSEWHCDVIQGYHLARPMPAEDFDAWMTQRESQAEAQAQAEAAARAAATAAPVPVAASGAKALPGTS